MTKKQTPVTVVVAEPEVNNSINMNLTHSDIIEVAIQTQLELLEPQLEAVHKEYTDLKSSLGKIQEDFLIKKAADKTGHPELADFMKVVKAVEKATNKKIEVSFSNTYFRDECQQLTSATYFVCEYDVEEYKSPLAMFRKNSREKREAWNISQNIQFNVYARSEDFYLEPKGKYFIVALSKEEHTKFKKQIQDVLDKLAPVGQRLYDLKKEILELKYDEKKVKARVVKMSLSKTEQGRNILNLLESATNVKLLS